MRHYKHLTLTDRRSIEAWLRVGICKSTISEKLGVHISTVYREIKRGEYEHLNSDYTTEMRYSADLAEQKYQESLREKGAGLKIGNDRQYADYIEFKIKEEKYSPAAVLGEIKAQGLEFNTTISKTTLYSYIDKGIFLTITNKDLPVKRNKTKQKYNKVKAKRAPRGTSIEKRPAEIAERVNFGHWEMDCVEGKKGTKKTLLVLTERYTRTEIIRLMPDKTTSSVIKALDRIERKYGTKTFKQIFKTITVDNGSEFSDFAGIERSISSGQRTSAYYCHPYSSYERGSNENANKLVRRHYPKGVSFERVTVKEISRLEKWINHYPRKIFNYHCSADILEACLNTIAA